MKKSRLDTPDLKVKLFEQIIMGERSQGAIARDLKVSPSALCRFLRQPNIKEQIEMLKMEVIRVCIESTVKNISHIIENYQTTSDFQTREHGFRASMRVLEISRQFTSGKGDVEKSSCVMTRKGK